MDLESVRVVLLRPWHGRNVGSVARAMKNFGLTKLVLAGVGEDLDEAAAAATAVRSGELLDAAERTPSLEAAVEGCAWVVGTTMRRRPGQRHLHPRAVAEAAARRTLEGEVALVFGSERSGLSDRELLRCHDVSVIPADPELASLNLAQAVLLYAWELAQVEPRPAFAPEPRARERDYAQIERALRAHADVAGFVDADRPRHGVADLVQTLKRAALTPAEARLWQAFLQKQGRAPR